MADFFIRIKADPRNAQKGISQVEKGLDRVEKKGLNVGKLLGRAFALIGAGYAVKQLAQIADEYTTIENRLRTVTKSTDELNTVTERLFEISNRTRSEFRATAEVYARVALASKDLGISQQETLDFTESLNKAVILSGASATEASAGLLQLSQGLASGTLRGDELRSVLEQLPVVADVIAKSMGITRGELRKMGEQGLITADIVLKAFREAKEDLDTGFGQTVPTLSQSFTVLKNNFVGLVGDLDSAGGVTRGISELILGLANNLDKLKDPIYFIGDVGTAIFEELKAILEPYIPLFEQIGDVATGVFKNLGILVVALVRTMAEWVDTLARLWGKFFLYLDKNFGDVIGGLIQLFLEFVNTASGLVQGLINGFIVALNAVRRALGQPLLDEINLLTFDTTKAAIAGQNLGNTIAEGLANSNLTGFVDNIITRVEDAQIQRQIDQSKPETSVDLTTKGQKNVPEAIDERAVALAGYNMELDREIELLKVNEQQGRIMQAIWEAEKKIKGDLTEAEKNLITEKIRTIDRLSLEKSLLNQIKGPQEQLAQTTAALNNLYATGQISLDEYNKALAALQGTEKELTANQEALLQGVSAVWDTGLSAVKDFAKGGEDAFQSFAANALSAIADIIAGLLKMQAIKFVAGALGLPVPGFATGGSFTVGGTGGTDSQLVAFRASPNERVSVETPSQQRSGASTSGGGVAVTIINVDDPARIREVMQSADGEKVIINVLAKNKSTVRQVTA